MVGYLLKILIVLLATLIVLGMALTIVAFLAWDINSKMILPEMVKEAGNWVISGENIGTYLEVLTGIVALLFPISLQIINDAKGDRFSSKEATTVVFNHWTFLSLRFILGFLILLTVLSFFCHLANWVVFIIMILMVGTLSVLFFYFNHLQKVIEDFSELVRKKEKEKIEDILRNG